MPTLRSILDSLTRLPRGASADGRPLGLGLAEALRAQQEQACRDEDRRVQQIASRTETTR